MTVPSSQPAIAAIIARLAPIPDHAVFDEAPLDEPPTRYLVVYDQTGLSIRRKYSGDAGWLYLPMQISCVARTKTGLRGSVRSVRQVLLGWPPVPGATPIVEDGSGPILREGEGNDLRLTGPLTLHCYLPPEEN